MPKIHSFRDVRELSRRGDRPISASKVLQPRHTSELIEANSRYRQIISDATSSDN